MNKLREKILNIYLEGNGNDNDRINAIIESVIEVLPQESTIFKKPDEFQRGRDTYFMNIRKVLLDAKNDYTEYEDMTEAQQEALDAYYNE